MRYHIICLTHLFEGSTICRGTNSIKITVKCIPCKHLVTAISKTYYLKFPCIICGIVTNLRIITSSMNTSTFRKDHIWQLRYLQVLVIQSYTIFYIVLYERLLTFCLSTKLQCSYNIWMHDIDDIRRLRLLFSDTKIEFISISLAWNIFLFLWFYWLSYKVKYNKENSISEFQPYFVSFNVVPWLENGGI